MSGLFERIARRRATPPDETQELAAPEALGTASTGDAPASSATPPGDGETAPARGEGVIEQPTVATGPVGPPPAEEATTEQRTVATEPVAEPPAEARAEATPSGPSFRERGRVRRRLRYLRRVREIQLRDLGGLVFELRRFGRHREDLVADKVSQLAATDEELRHLEDVLADPRAVTELREPGIGGTCPACGTLHGSADHYCANCGRPLAESTNGHHAPPESEPQHVEAATEPQEPHGVA